MGFFIRKRNPKGLNLSISKKGIRLSKTIKMGSVTYNLGHTFFGENNGKTTGRINANLGNGLHYIKQKTFSNKTLKPNITTNNSSLPIENLTAEKIQLSAFKPYDFSANIQNNEISTGNNIFLKIILTTMPVIWLLTPVILYYIIELCFQFWGFIGLNTTFVYKNLSGMELFQHTVNTIICVSYLVAIFLLSALYSEENNNPMESFPFRVYIVSAVCYTLYSSLIIVYNLVS